MAKPNYNYEKRQRELAKKKKQEAKLQKKTAKNEPEPNAGDQPAGTAESTGTDVPRGS